MKIGKMVLKGCIPVLAVVAIFVVFSAKSSSQESPSGMESPDVIIGEYCFNISSYCDTWHLQFDDKGNGFYDITGFDECYDSLGYMSSISGSAHRVGKHIYGTFTMGLHAIQSSFMVCSFDFNVKTWTGICDMTWFDVSGVSYVYYENWSFAMVACSMADRVGQGPLSGVRVQ